MAEDTTGLPGVTTMSFDVKEFDFMSAMDFIKGKLSHKFLKEQWPNSLVDAFTASMTKVPNPSNNKPGYNPYSGLSPYSVAWFSIKFLNVLWDLLFGRTTSSAPWLDLMKGLKPFNVNGTADRLIDFDNKVKGISAAPAEAEKIVCQELGQYFPMKLLMPEIIIPTPQAESSKPLLQASKDVDALEVEPPVNELSRVQLNCSFPSGSK